LKAKIINSEFGVADQHANRSNEDKTSLKFLVERFHIKSFVDIGCGLGGQVSIARNMGLKAIGIDGDPTIKEFDGLTRHDYTKGPLKIETTDLGWSSAFIEHVFEKHMSNFMETFACCKYACTTYAPKGLGGRHHVNCQDEKYWIEVFKKYGFEFHMDISDTIRQISEHKWMSKFALFFVRIA
jgi:hypothetical protein